MLLKKEVKAIETFFLRLDNTITARETKNGCLIDYKLEYKETLVHLDNAITINLYQFQDIYLNKTNYYLIFDYVKDNYSLYKEID